MLNGIKTKHKVLIVSIIVFCIVVGCLVIFQMRYMQEMAMQLEDKNGDDKALCILTDNDIKDITHEYRSLKRQVQSKGLNTSGVSGFFEDYDNDYTKTTIGTLSGIYVCNAVKGSGSLVRYIIDSTVYSGNFRIVITDEDNNILVDVPIDSKETVEIKTERDKDYYVKFVAESANFEAEVWRTIEP